MVADSTARSVSGIIILNTCACVCAHVHTMENNYEINTVSLLTKLLTLIILYFMRKCKIWGSSNENVKMNK